MLAKQQSALEQEPLGVLVAAARRGIKQATSSRLRGSGLSPQQFWLLMGVHENRGTSLRELCELRRMDAPTASRVVATLAAKRLVRIGDDRADRRRCRLELTAAGDALARRLEPLLHELRQALVAGLTRSEQDALHGLLRRLIANTARMGRAEAGSRAAHEKEVETR